MKELGQIYISADTPEKLDYEYLSGGINTLSNKVGELSTNVKTISSDVEDIEDEVDGLIDDVDEISGDVDDLKDSVEELITKTDTISSDVDCIKEDYLSLSAGGTVESDVTIKGKAIINGNFVHSNEESNVVVIEGTENVFVNSDSISGVTYVGTKGWCILDIDLSDSTVKLSGDASELADYGGQKVSLRVGSFSYNGQMTVNPDEISFDDENTIVKLDVLSAILHGRNKYFKNTDENAEKFEEMNSEENYISLFGLNANLFYLPEHPSLGNQNSQYRGQFTNGVGTKAIESFTHTEGRGTLADGSFSHAEGDGTRAFGFASHAEGISCTVLGNAAHAEGYYCSASGNHSFAKGLSSHANGHCSFAFGQSIIADGEDSAALGVLSKTVDDCSFVWNPGEFENGVRKDYFSKGWGSFAINPVGRENGFWIGDTTLGNLIRGEVDSVKDVISARVGFSAGGGRVTGQSSMSLGSQSFAKGAGSIAVGRATTSDSYTAAIGQDVSAAAWATFAHGNNTIAKGAGAFASGNNVKVLGTYSFGQGQSVFVDSKLENGTINLTQSQAIGTNVSALGSYQTVIGTNAKGEKNHAKTFVWSATNSAALSVRPDGGVYSSHGSNTFNICPGAAPDTANMIDNFYVGNKTITNAILEKFSKDCVLSGAKSLAIGDQCEVLSGGNYSVALGFKSKIGEKVGNSANDYSFAIGIECSAMSRTAFAIGRKSKTTKTNQFVWSGTTIEYSAPEKEGAFCIDPKDGKDNVFIGQKSLPLNVIESIQENDISTKMTLGTRKSGSVNGYASFVNGYNCIAISSYSHAEGSETSAFGESTHTEGDRCVAISAFSHAEGSMTLASGTASHAEGGGTKSLDLATHAEGAYTTASGIASHAEGLGLPILDQTQLARGKIVVLGTLGGESEGAVSHVEGIGTLASGLGSHVCGVNATDLSNAFSYVWSGYDGDVLTKEQIKILTDGDYGEKHMAQFPEAATIAQAMFDGSKTYYARHQGSYCINPVPMDLFVDPPQTRAMAAPEWPFEGHDEPYSGFWIGDKNFIQCVLDVIQKNPDIVKMALGLL